MKCKTVSIMLLLAATLACAAQTINLPFGPWSRASNDPILSPQGSTWESAGTFNPAVILHNGKIVMLYRAQDASGTSRLGYAESSDGIHFARRPEPVLSPKLPMKKTAASKTRASRNSAIRTTSPTPATTKKTPSSASLHRAISSTGSVKA
jgi:hypothetical protein